MSWGVNFFCRIFNTYCLISSSFEFSSEFESVQYFSAGPTRLQHGGCWAGPWRPPGGIPADDDSDDDVDDDHGDEYDDGDDIVSYPTWWSLLFIFGFLYWSFIHFPAKYYFLVCTGVKMLIFKEKNNICTFVVQNKGYLCKKNMNSLTEKDGNLLTSKRSLAL